MSPADGGCRSSAAAEERIFRNCILAGFRSAGSRCENSGSSDDTCASARSGSTKQRSLLCPLSERGCRHPLLFAVLDLLVLLDQAKSTRKESVRRKLFERSFAMRKLLCASRNNDFDSFYSVLAGRRPAGSHCEDGENRRPYFTAERIFRKKTHVRPGVPAALLRISIKSRKSDGKNR